MMTQQLRTRAWAAKNSFPRKNKTRAGDKANIFSGETALSKLPERVRTLRISPIRPPGRDVIIGETYRKSVLLYSGANSRVVRLSIGH